MPYRTFIATIILGLALPAAAEFRTVSLAYEIALDNFTAPPSLNSAATFRHCDTCESQSLRVTGATVYTINEENVTLQEFRARIINVPNRPDKTVIVLHHLASDTVEHILLDL